MEHWNLLTSRMLFVVYIVAHFENLRYEPDFRGNGNAF